VPVTAFGLDLLLLLHDRLFGRIWLEECMRRREFIALLGGVAAAWPLALRAQQRDGVRRIAILMVTADDADGQARITALREGLQRLGWTEGHNLRIDTRWAAGDADRMQTYVTELVQANPDAILANGSPAVAALRQETRSIPIIFAAVVDPLGQGFVSNLARPGSNITGFTNMEFTVLGKMLELLKRMAPNMTRAAALFNPATGIYVPGYLHLFEASSPPLGIELATAPVHDVSEVEDTIAKLGHEPGGGLVVPPEAFTITHHKLIIASTARHRLPAIYAYRSFVGDGGLMSYGPDPYDIFRRAASYVDRILRGEKPGELPVQQPTKFQFAVNLKTAKALGLEMPPDLPALADEVIE
jgi:putative ABC transport system substrate-binding protein